MKRDDIQKRIAKLTELIRHHANLYYHKDAPEISDEAYDSLYQELLSLEAEYPEFRDPDSPTLRVGGRILEGFSKVQHQFPQWSFDNLFNADDLVAWEGKVHRMIEKEPLLKHEPLEYVVELKIDGLKVILDYEQGRFVRGATRGDGKVGEDITENLKTIRGIPLSVTEKKPFSVIGEVWIARRELVRINEERELQGLEPYANPRNLAAGTLRQLDTRVVAERNLQISVYDLDSRELAFDTHIQELDFLQQQGFSINTEFLHTDRLDDIQAYYASWIGRRHSQNYGVDGLVIKINSKKITDLLGYTAKAPRFAIAYKFPAEQKTTQVRDIVLQVGRTGVMTPVAELEAVDIDGSRVSRATLHNMSEIERLGIMIGDTVIIEKSGDIIPKIKKVLVDLRHGDEHPFDIQHFLKLHGISAKETVSNAGVITWHVLGESDEVKIQKIIHGVSKKALNVDGMGEQHVRSLFQAGYINTIADIFSLTKEDLLTLPLFKEKASDNLIEAITKSRRADFARVIVALGIPFVGEEVARIYAQHFSSTKALKEASYDTLIALFGVGEKIAESTLTWFLHEDHLRLYDRLCAELDIQYPQASTLEQIFEGQHFVITGSLDAFSRDTLKALLEERGGKVHSAVSSQTDILIAGKKAGSKLQKARDLGITVYTEADILKALA